MEHNGRSNWITAAAVGLWLAMIGMVVWLLGGAVAP